MSKSKSQQQTSNQIKQLALNIYPIKVVSYGHPFKSRTWLWTSIQIKECVSCIYTPQHAPGRTGIRIAAFHTWSAVALLKIKFRSPGSFDFPFVPSEVSISLVIPCFLREFFMFKELLAWHMPSIRYILHHVFCCCICVIMTRLFLVDFFSALL